MPDQGYTVDRKEEFRRMIRTGEVETWYRVYATTRRGTYYHVEVPETALADAGKVLAERARQLDSI